jgi:hypothetical protein
MTWWRRMLRRRALEREVAEGVRAGQSEADVRRQIRLTSGGLDQVKEECRDVRRPRALADVGADLRFAWRILARNGWATAGAILTLALAMGGRGRPRVLCLDSAARRGRSLTPARKRCIYIL